MSSQKINYNLRPSKTIERKLILEVLKEYSTICKINEYQYIGFGAIYFYDFKLFHHELNIVNMVSIERKTSELERCEFNRPFKCISIEEGHSNHVLPKLNWDKKSIVWLDYDGSLKKEALIDIETCTKKLKQNSFFILTVRKDLHYETIEGLKEEFGEDTPDDITKPDLEPAFHYKTIRKIILNKVEKTLSEHYAATREGEKIVFKQIFNFLYQDGAWMYTIGGVFLKENESETFDKFKFINLPYISQNEEAYKINFPLVTNKEIHTLNKYLPCKKEDFMQEVDLQFIPKEQRENYYNIYRHFPAYIEINIF